MFSINQILIIGHQFPSNTIHAPSYVPNYLFNTPLLGFMRIVEKFKNVIH